MIAKRGQYIRWHWAYKARITCDPWKESETAWHRYWKNAFPVDCQEVVQLDDRNHEKNIADVRTDAGFVFEVQRSPISEIEARSRENFYGELIWIVDVLFAPCALQARGDRIGATTDPVVAERRQLPGFAFPRLCPHAARNHFERSSLPLSVEHHNQEFGDRVHIR